MAHLFDSLTLRGTTIPSRIFLSPMCQYSAVDGMPNDWHFVHLGSRAVGGAGLLIVEATGVTPEGRISPHDLGLWNDVQADAFARMVRFVAAQGCHPAIQLAHAGRKASTHRPWDGVGAVPIESGGWIPVAPSPIPFAADFATPRELDAAGIAGVVRAFTDAAVRAREAGFHVAEIHAAHGYLLHEFLSPLTNQRHDAYGGSFENRIRLLVEVATAVRGVWPEARPVFVRISATDWADGGWDLEQSIELVRRLGPIGVDLVDCSSGGNIATAVMPLGPGYQTAFAAEIRRATGVPTGTVGLITTAVQADHIVRTGQADAVLFAREMLRDPYFPIRAARQLHQKTSWPAQYLRAAPPGSVPRAPLES